MCCINSLLNQVMWYIGTKEKGLALFMFIPRTTHEKELFMINLESGDFESPTYMRPKA